MTFKPLALAAAALAALSAAGLSAPLAAPAPYALTGQVASAEEGPMEGVLVTVKRGTIATTVVTDAQGRYRFPRGRLAAGSYKLSVKAVGYDLDGGGAVTVSPAGAARADLKLKKTADLAAQLSNAEWLASWPGTPAQKTAVSQCTHCHTLERIARSTYDVEAFVPLVTRMLNYPQLSFPLHPQLAPAPRIANPPPTPAAIRQIAEYLVTVNRSRGPWTYELKTLPRPKGRATQVIYTEYDLPSPTRQPHDVIVDAKGAAWYADFGDQILGKLDPATGKVVEYKVPTTKPGSPTGILGVRFDNEGKIWLGAQYQSALVRFDPATAAFKTYRIPPELDRPDFQINMMAAEHADVDGKVWLQDSGSYQVLRLDLKTGKYEVFTPFPAMPRPNIYDVMSDTQNNAYFTVMGGQEIGRIDAKTGKIEMWKTPTAGSAPRRGAMDAQGRLWFGENRGDKIGMFDPKTNAFKEWSPPTPGAYPYDAVADAHGEVWAGGEYDDRILRLDPASGAMVQYLMPRETNVRRVFVQNTTTPATFWVGNTHEGSIVKLEPLDAQQQRASR